MAGWPNPSAAASGPGGGGGGWRFTSGGSRRRERGRGRAPPPVQTPHYRYRPVHSNSIGNAHPSPPPPPHHHRPMDQHPEASTSARPRLAPPAISPPASDDAAASRNAANFECNVCFDMAADPVVTSCGHLFCWECLYQWLHVHSQHRECPVCKGQVADDAIIPIYGRGGSAACLHTAPPRPTAARVESCRQQDDLNLNLNLTLNLPLEDDDEELDPFDLQWILGYGSRSPAWSREMPSLQLDYDDYTNVNDYDGFDDYDLLGFPVFASSQGQGQGHGVADDIMEALFSSGDIGTRHQLHHQRRGRRRGQARARARTMARAEDYSSADGIDIVHDIDPNNVRDADRGPNVIRGDSPGSHGGWTTRRGRSNQNWNSSNGTARGGMQNSRRQRRNSNW